MYSHAQRCSSRSKHAARHLLSCASLSAGDETFGGLEPHDAYCDPATAGACPQELVLELGGVRPGPVVYNSEDQLC